MAGDYAICYYRDRKWSERFAKAGISKPPGWVTSDHRSAREDVERAVDAINRQKPEFPAHPVRLS